MHFSDTHHVGVQAAKHLLLGLMPMQHGLSVIRVRMTGYILMDISCLIPTSSHDMLIAVFLLGIVPDGIDLSM